MMFSEIKELAMTSKNTWIGTADGVYEWSNGENWSRGTAPVANTTAVIDGAGHYEIDVNTAVVVHELELDSRNAFLVETAGGSIQAHNLVMEFGVAELNVANNFAVVNMEGGFVELGDDHALGTKTIHTLAGTIEANAASINLHNAIAIADVGIFAAHGGDMLTLSGAITATNIPGSNGYVTEFGGSSGPQFYAPDETGTVIITSTSFIDEASIRFNDVFVDTGTVKSGQGTHALGANQLFSDATYVLIQAAGTLDVRNFGTDVTLNKLDGTGKLVGNSGITVHVTNPTFTGTLSAVTMEAGGTGHFGGHMGSSSFTMAAGTDTLDFSNALDGNITVSAPDGSTSVITVGPHTAEHFTDFQDGNLTIDVAVGSATHVSFIQDADDLRMVIHPNHGFKAFSLYFNGVTSSDDLTLGDDGHGHLQVTWGGAAEAQAHLVTSHDPWAAHDFI
jgi:hypothetical protein